MVLLVALTSHCLATELTALPCNLPYVIFSQDKVALNTDITFLPKMASHFHMSQPIFPTFYPSPQNDLESSLHSLDIRRALAFYLDRTKDFRHTNRLFVCYHDRTGQGRKRDTLSSLNASLNGSLMLLLWPTNQQINPCLWLSISIPQGESPPPLYFYMEWAYRKSAMGNMV